MSLLRFNREHFIDYVSEAPLLSPERCVSKLSRRDGAGIPDGFRPAEDILALEEEATAPPVSRQLPFRSRTFAVLGLTRRTVDDVDDLGIASFRGRLTVDWPLLSKFLDCGRGLFCVDCRGFSTLVEARFANGSATTGPTLFSSFSCQVLH